MHTRLGQIFTAKHTAATEHKKMPLLLYVLRKVEGETTLSYHQTPIKMFTI